MTVKQNKKESAIARNSSRRRRRLLAIPTIALFIKLFIIVKIQGFDWYANSSGDLASGLNKLLEGTKPPAGIWYGADGENYIKALSGLASDGLFSTEQKLSYWPAGYPLLLWPVLVIFKGFFFPGIAILQSALYALGCAFFVDEISRTRITRFALPVALLLTLNPTLALNTMAIGYELPVLSLILIAVAAMLRSIRLMRSSIFSSEALIASIALLLITIMQPRFIVIALALLAIWAVAQYPIKSSLAFLALTFLIVAIAPASLIMRNQVANGYPSISTNLGNTMATGNGPKATGGYQNQSSGIQCPQADALTRPDQVDSARVKCVVKWQINHPVETTKLFWNKARFFWSPWFGTEANGTMARNPWRINHPLNETVKTKAGYDLVTGPIGKASSWIWVIATLAFMWIGARFLWKAGRVERLLGVSAFTIVLINWLSSIITIGDHRFRIPTMGMSLFLQTMGFMQIFLRGRSRLTGSSPSPSWAGLRWKRSSGGDILPSGTDN